MIDEQYESDNDIDVEGPYLSDNSIPDLVGSSEDEDDEVDIINPPLNATMYELLTAFSNQNPLHFISSSLIVDDLEERMLSEAIVQSQNTPQPVTKHVMKTEDFKTLETYTFVEIENETPKECPIAMMPFEVGDVIVVLPCKHEFLKESIMKWLTTESAKCPVCRHELKSHEVTEIS